jgi:hypothetical protein
MGPRIGSAPEGSLSEAISAEFGDGTPLSRAMVLTMERLIPAEPDAWFVQGEGDEVAAYVLAGPVIHELRGKRPGNDTAPVPSPDSTRSACSYRVLKVTPDATFSCNVVQTEAGAGAEVTEIEEAWQFNLGSGRVIKIAGRPPLPAGRLPFAVALVAAIHAGPA